MHQKLKQNCVQFDVKNGRILTFIDRPIIANCKISHVVSLENKFGRNYMLFTSRLPSAYKLRILNSYMYENRLNKKKIVFTLINSCRLDRGVTAHRKQKDDSYS